MNTASIKNRTPLRAASAFARALPFWIAAVAAAAILASGLFFLSRAQPRSAADGESMDSRLRRLEDREEIRRLLLDYGRTLDQRDFKAFSSLFAQDAEYAGGGGMGVIKGPEAIAKSLEAVILQNPTGFRSPNFHLFSNEVIEIRGDEAVAVSKGMFVVPRADNRPEIVMLAAYDDVLTRESGRWKFRKRTVRGEIPAPPAANINSAKP